MRILAIDPGLEQSAYLFLSEEIGPFGTLSNTEIVRLIDDCSEAIVIEEIRCFGMAIGRETLDTVRWTGRFQEAAVRNGAEVTFVGRKDVVMHWCGSARAKDSNLRRALIDFYGKPGTKRAPGATYRIKADVWSALGIAGYFAQTMLARSATNEWTIPESAMAS